jgi:hypothetical protein
MDMDLTEKLSEQEKEIEFLRREVKRLRAALSKTSDTVEDMLQRRGFRIYRKRSAEGVIMPRPATRKRIDEYYGWLMRYSFRLFLRDVIKRSGPFSPEELVRYSSIDTVEGFCAYLTKAGILAGRDGKYELKSTGITSFGPTLEWFVAEVLRREFVADTVWGVRFKDNAAGGDYDVMAAVEGRLVYAEVKSSPPKQIYVNEVGAYIGRVAELGPDLSLFIVDTELRMKDKVVTLFEEAIPGTRFEGNKVERFKDEIFKLDDRMFIVNSKGGLVSNIGEVLGWHLRRV